MPTVYYLPRLSFNSVPARIVSEEEVWSADLATIRRIMAPETDQRRITRRKTNCLSIATLCKSTLSQAISRPETEVMYDHYNNGQV